MIFIKVNILSIFLLLLFVQICLTDGETGYIETCTCLKESSNGNYCAEQSCTAQYKYNKCFSGRSTVRTRDGKDISLSNIQIGQEVLVFYRNKLIFQPIYDIIHRENSKFYTFIHLTVFNHYENLTHSIEISSKHLIYKYGLLDPVFASQIEIGDYLQLVNQFKIIPGKVIQIDEIISQGYSAPLTPSGTIVVNNIVSSNYAEARNHHLAHLVMQPYRWWRNIFESKKTIQTDLNWYISILYYFANKTGFLNIL
ncbi:unnamed protein product [Rotaria sordida]|uniref:Hint domain-containing protein n=2 Tax=Rotaria sordida TaxID=392033 RepID=A0A813RB44_9BILA|nr:unnamed protein product [Rotaria sordida]CAF1376721.1 unnamed protein product [Rotaria sordida]CAF3928608.1 unnamed protein product [Rotaria sordida]